MTIHKKMYIFMYHGTFSSTIVLCECTIVQHNVPWYITMYHGTVWMYHGTTQCTMVQCECTMVHFQVPWYSVNVPWYIHTVPWYMFFGFLFTKAVPRKHFFKKILPEKFQNMFPRYFIVHVFWPLQRRLIVVTSIQSLTPVKKNISKANASEFIKNCEDSFLDSTSIVMFKYQWWHIAKHGHMSNTIENVFLVIRSLPM